MRRRDLSKALLASATAPVNLSYPPGNVLRWGADQTGVTDSTQAIQYAINIAWASSYYASPWSGQAERRRSCSFHRVDTGSAIPLLSPTE